jgi:dolichol-phosphate mannosyltransferase
LKILIVIPTLNEVKSLTSIIKKIKYQKIDLKILFVDDNSNDGTQQLIKSISKKDKNIKFIFRNKNHGLGAAIKSGLKYAIKNNYHLCFTMDADGTHDPKKINLMLKIIREKVIDIVSTNRFFLINSMKNWPYLRIFLTRLRYLLVKIFLNTKLDSSGNFRCYNLKKIKNRHLFLSKNNSYFFLIESLFYLEKLKYKIKEIPIYLNPRTFGNSKMKFRHIFNSLLCLITLRIRILLNPIF